MLLTSVGALFEILSLASIFPVLAYILDPASSLQSEVMQFVKFLLNFIPISEAYGLGIFFALVFFTSSIFRIILVWLQVSWGNAVGHDFSVLIFSRLLDQNYEEHITRNTSEVVAGVTTKINQLVGNYINPFVAICSSVFLLIAIIAALVFVAGLEVFVIVVSIGLIYAGIIFSVRYRLSYNSRIINDRASSIIQQVQESFQGVREVILSATGQTRKISFTLMDKEFRMAQSSSALLSQAPRYIVECILVISLVGLALMQAGNISLSDKALPSLGVVVLGIQRIMPLAQIIYANLATMKGATNSVDDIIAMASVESDIDMGYREKSSETISFERSLLLDDVSYRYPGSEKNQLEKIRLSIKKGDWVGFYGETGSGKSTLLDLICGLLNPTTGSLLTDGVEITAHNHVEWRSKLAVVSQSAHFSDATVVEIIAMGEQNPNLERLNACLDVAQLGKTIKGLKLGIYTRLGEAGVQLSGGQLQRLSIARALYKDAEILIFDEATSALDQNTEKMLMDALLCLKSKPTVITVAHRLETLKMCKTLYQMKDGRIVACGTYEQLIRGVSTGVREA